MEKYTIAKLFECLPKHSDKQIQKTLKLKGKTKEFIDYILQIKAVSENCAEKGINIIPRPENYFSHKVTIRNNSHVLSSFDPRVTRLKGKEVIVTDDFCERNGIRVYKVIPLYEIVNDDKPIYINPKFFEQKTVSNVLKNKLGI